MAEEYVGRKEFDSLKEEVNEIKKDLDESQKLLTQIDKKIDIINEKVLTSDKIEELKLIPLEKRVDKLEDSQTWLRRTLIAEVITVVAGAIMYVIQVMK
jgi:hypothetical protein